MGSLRLRRRAGSVRKNGIGAGALLATILVASSALGVDPESSAAFPLLPPEQDEPAPSDPATSASSPTTDEAPSRPSPPTDQGSLAPSPAPSTSSPVAAPGTEASAASYVPPDATVAPGSQAYPSSSPTSPFAPPTDPAVDQSRNGGQRDDSTFSDDWMLSISAVANVPVDVGGQVGFEFPFPVRIHGSYGFVPTGFLKLLTGLKSGGLGDDVVSSALIDGSRGGTAWRLQAGLRPIAGFYADVGLSSVHVSGALSASDLDPRGGAASLEAETTINAWLVELGYQAWVGDHLILAIGGGFMRVTSSTTTARATAGQYQVPARATERVDQTIENNGLVPTLTGRVGFDLL